MCEHCWEDMGRPWKPEDPKVKECARLIDVVEEQHTLGLHIIIDDWNIDDGNVKSALGWELTEDEKKVIDMMQDMSEQDRGASLALSHAHQGYYLFKEMLG